MSVRVKHFSLLFLLLVASFSSLAARQVTDQLGRQVTIPDRVDRVVVLQHQTLNLLVQLDATQTMVGILSNWKQQLGDNYQQLVPALNNIPLLGDLTHVDPEKLVAMHPQVVFVTNYAPQEMIDQISQLGIPVIAISLRAGDAQQQAQLNPTLQDEDKAYDQGLEQGIRLIGNVVNRQQQAEALIQAAFAQRALIAERLKDIPPQQRIRVYMANPELTTYGSGKYTGLMMSHAGALNVAAATVKGFKQVAMEQVVAWDPQVIFVQDRYPQVPAEINNSAQWQTIAAVKNQQVYLMPEYAKAWGYPMPEAVGLGELWMAKKLYPQRFADIDMQKLAQQWYQRFYRSNYQAAE